MNPDFFLRRAKFPLPISSELLPTIAMFGIAEYATNGKHRSSDR
jgi:hypothetical protein